MPVLVRHRAGLTRFTYANHPFDVVGWDGCLYPWVFNIRDFEPITGRVHQPPPVHQTFEGPNFVVCSFCPRKVDYHPLSIPVPYNHANVDSDELMFYVGGNYEARKGSGIGLGSLSLHPSGFTHGPQPGAAEASIGVDYFDETAVMVDTFRPLELGEAAGDLRRPCVRMVMVGARTRSAESGETVTAREPTLLAADCQDWGTSVRSRPASARPKTALSAVLTLAAGVLVALTTAPTAAAAVPSGFTDTVAIGGLTNPTVAAFAPNGRVFVGEKSGVVKTFDSLADTHRDGHRRPAHGRCRTSGTAGCSA